MGVEVIVSVDDRHLDQLEEIARELAQLGMTDQRRLDSLGVIIGVVDPERLDAIEAIPGVEDVELSRVVQLPPPDSPVQ